MEVGYLGTHCSITSIQITLPKKCTRKQYFDSSPFYSYIMYTCTAPTPLSEPPSQTWRYVIDYAGNDCQGQALQMKGISILENY